MLSRAPTAAHSSSLLFCVQEFVTILSRLDIGLTEPQIYELMRSVDADSNSMIDFAEFANVCKQTTARAHADAVNIGHPSLLVGL